MNISSPAQIATLREAFAAGASVRGAARRANVTRQTAHRWRQIFLATGRERRQFSVSLERSTKERYRREAKRTGLSLAAFIDLVLETVAEDDLFAAILD